MTLSEIRKIPETIVASEWSGARSWHESVVRSYQVLEKARDWLKRGAPGSVVLEMIEDAYSEEKKR